MSAVGDRRQQLRAAFSFGFAHRLAQGGGAAGVFDGSGREQLAVGTETGKICLQAIESMFNVNEQITCLAIYPRTRTDADHYDVVLVGTTSSLLALDVYNNRTLFHRNMPEGVHCVRVGHVDAHRDSDVIVCGCGTTIWGFHLDGSDVFWTALGDEVNVVELCDMDGDGQNELIVGTGGADIKVLKNASFFAEFDEGNPTTALCALGPACFAFGLASGVVGVYANGERLWRVKTKSPIVALLQFPAHARVACVWQNAKIDIRAASTGEICAREQFEDGGELSAAFLADLAGTGPLDDGQPRPQLTLVFCNGQVRALEFCNELADEKGQLLRNISQRKHALLEELKTYDRRGSNASAAEAGGGGVAECSLIPPGTMLTCTLALMSAAEQQEHAASAVAASSSSPTNDVTAVTVWSSSSINAHAARNASGDSLCVRLTLSNSVPIRAVLLFADGIFDSECIAIHPNGKESAEMVVQFNPVKNVQANLFVKVFAGYSIERQLRVFAADLLLPRFVTFVQVEPPTFAETPEAFVAFRLHCRENKLRQWVFENFAFIGEQQVDADEAETDQQHNNNNNSSNSSKFQLRFMCTRNQQPLLLELDTAGGNVELRHNDIQNAADILQSLCAFLGVRALSSRAHFPQVLDAVKSVVENMDRRYEVNERLASEFAERLNVVRECVVRAEDALAIQNFAESRRLYTRVTMLNRELCGQQTIWMAAKKELLDAMKFLNVSIEQFSRLRVGAPGASLVQECRKAIAGDKLDIVPKLLEFGVFD